MFLNSLILSLLELISSNSFNQVIKTSGKTSGILILFLENI
jgi:hypothetical protein